MASTGMESAGFTTDGKQLMKYTHSANYQVRLGSWRPFSWKLRASRLMTRAFQVSRLANYQVCALMLARLAV